MVIFFKLRAEHLYNNFQRERQTDRQTGKQIGRETDRYKEKSTFEFTKVIVQSKSWNVMFVLKYEEYKFCIFFSMFLNNFAEYHDINLIFYFIYRLKNKAKRLPGSKLSDVYL